jgi:adenine-specific DNA-methyltransferase
MNAKEIAKRTRKGRTKSQVLLAQFFTAQPIAEYMASLFSVRKNLKASILDPGAGEGILGLTLMKRLEHEAKSTVATFVEFDSSTYEKLLANLQAYTKDHQISIVNEDFIDAAYTMQDQGMRFSHIIMNPPYFKLRVDSKSNIKLRSSGIHVTNIYAAFVWLSAKLLADKGELVAIIPRSFCNGPYFARFRQFLFDGFSLDTIHIFSSRNKAFSKDSVLQENIIIHISKQPQQPMVKITYSTDQTFEDIAVRQVPFEQVVSGANDSKIIHIPAENQTLSLTEHVVGKLDDLGIKASTGPIVDFRLKDSIKETSDKSTIPLLYPAHMSGQRIEWPRDSFNKAGQHYQPVESSNSRLLNQDESTDKQALPLDGYYVVVRRFSSKEEKRRIFAAVVEPDALPTKYVTFENHLNYFHAKKHGFNKDLAFGLCAYLNSSLLDEHFRKVSGHTQVNVSDLKNMPYPNRETLEKIGGIMQSIDELKNDIVVKEVMGKIS